MINVYCNGHPVSTKEWRFPAGETGIQMSSFYDPNYNTDVVVEFDSNDDLMNAAFYADSLRRMGVKGRKRLIIPYFPYARQDRVCHEGEAFQLRVVADFINSMQYDEVVIFDPHSDVTPALINNVRVVRPYKAFDAAVRRLQSLANGMAPRILAPDAGASKRVRDMMDKSKPAGEYSMLQALKVRRGDRLDVTLCFAVEMIPQHQPLIIVDDICDGGATFLQLAKAIRSAPGYRGFPIYLFVTHGLFTKGVKALEGAVDGVMYLDNYDPDVKFEDQPFAYTHLKRKTDNHAQPV